MFQAVACSLAVRGGSGGVVEIPDAVAASRCRNATSSQVTYAWSQVPIHLATCYGLSLRSSHQDAQNQSRNKLESSSHWDCLREFERGFMLRVGLWLEN
ncbi:hypothetical protein SKA57_15805, partial [Enterococcus faecium]